VRVPRVLTLLTEN